MNMYTYESLRECMDYRKQGYSQSEITPGFWTHKWRPISFALTGDGFGVKYVGREHAEHMLSVLNNEYETSHEWAGEWYIGLTINWDYLQRMVHISMPGYCKRAGRRFHHDMPAKRQDQPYAHVETKYGNKVQYAANEYTSPQLNKDQKLISKKFLALFFTTHEQ